MDRFCELELSRFQVRTLDQTNQHDPGTVHIYSIRVNKPNSPATVQQRADGLDGHHDVAESRCLRGREPACFPGLKVHRIYTSVILFLNALFLQMYRYPRIKKSGRPRRRQCTLKACGETEVVTHATQAADVHSRDSSGRGGRTCRCFAQARQPTATGVTIDFFFSAE